MIAASSGLFGCLGTGIPFGMAAKLARPGTKVVVLNGDGSFGFNAMEFDTMVRHNIPVVVVINNDCAWGMIKHSQELSIGKDRLQCSELGIAALRKGGRGPGRARRVRHERRGDHTGARAGLRLRQARVRERDDGPDRDEPGDAALLPVVEDGVMFHQQRV